MNLKNKLKKKIIKSIIIEYFLFLLKNFWICHSSWGSWASCVSLWRNYCRWHSVRVWCWNWITAIFRVLGRIEGHHSLMVRREMMSMYISRLSLAIWNLKGKKGLKLSFFTCEINSECFMLLPMRSVFLVIREGPKAVFKAIVCLLSDKITPKD